MRSLLAAICLVPALWAQSGAQLATFRSTADGTDQPYALYVPRSFDASRQYPLLVSLHSEDTNHRMNLRQVFGLSIRSGEANPEDLRYFPAARDMGFLVASPFARGTMDYQGVSERDVFDMLAEVRKRYPVDPDRIYLTGVSMGGAAALRLALTRPDLWAAVAPVCPSALSGMDDLAGNASNLAIRIFQGEADPISPVANARQWQRRLVDAGVNADYVEYPGVRHNAWDLAYRNGGIFEWLAKHRRNPTPERVELATRSYRDASAYWLRIDGLTPGTLATVEARRTGTDVLVRTANVDGFTLNLDRAALVTIDGAPLRMRAGAALAFSKAAGKWRAGKFEPTGKRPGIEGPIVDAVRGRAIYVYGTVGATAEALDARKRVADAAAEWSGARGARPIVRFPVRADNTITPDEIANSDLVLFGTRETNSLIARLAPQFPLSLNPGAADYGLLFVAPSDGHYVLVSSGLPWWTGAEEARRGGPPLASDQFRLLSTFGDYILFKGSLANVVAEGRFDTNWKVPAADAAKLAASGTVTVQ